MLIITSMTDVTAWARDHGLAIGATPDECDTLAANIRRDDEHPRWGSDWEDYLARVDIPEAILDNEIVLRPERA